MKINTLSITLFIFVICVLPSCSYNTIPVYNEKPAIYFSNFSVEHDSLLYTFSVTNKKDDIIYLNVKILGAFLDQEKKFYLKIEDNSTAVEERDFEPIADYYIFPANSSSVDIPIKIKNNDILKNKTVSLNLSLQASEDLELGYLDKVKVRIIFTDQIIKPVYWDDFFFLYFGEYSKVKHRKAIEIMGHDFPLTRKETSGWGGLSYYTYWMIKGRELAYFYAVHPNEKDENGNIIPTWSAF